MNQIPFELDQPKSKQVSIPSFISEIPPLENQFEIISNQYEQLKSTITNEFCDIYKDDLHYFY